MIHEGYSRSYSISSLPCMTHVNTYQYRHSFDSSKDRLDTKILSQFSKLPDKNLSSVLFYHLKTEHARAIGRCFPCTCKRSLLCFSRNKSFLEILSGGEYNKSWFLFQTQDSVFTFRNLICSRLEHCCGFVSSRNAP